MWRYRCSLSEECNVLLSSGSLYTPWRDRQTYRLLSSRIRSKLNGLQSDVCLKLTVMHSWSSGQKQPSPCPPPAPGPDGWDGEASEDPSSDLCLRWQTQHPPPGAGIKGATPPSAARLLWHHYRCFYSCFVLLIDSLIYYKTCESC